MNEYLTHMCTHAVWHSATPFHLHSQAGLLTTTVPESKGAVYVGVWYPEKFQEQFHFSPLTKPCGSCRRLPVRAFSVREALLLGAAMHRMALVTSSVDVCRILLSYGSCFLL